MRHGTGNTRDIKTFSPLNNLITRADVNIIVPQLKIRITKIIKQLHISPVNIFDFIRPIVISADNTGG